MDPKISPFSLFSVRLTQLRAGQIIGYGTGFIYRHLKADRNFLVTNYHVLTGRDPRDPASLEPGYPDSPDELAWAAFARPNFEPCLGSISLGSDTQWLEHRNRPLGVDIVALAVSFPNDALVVRHSDLQLDQHVAAQIGTEVFLVGYPYGFGVHDLLPIWKRGTVASEPSAMPDGLQKFYVDAYSHPGMSGAPVFAVGRHESFRLSRESAQLFNAAQRGELSALEFVSKIDVSDLQQTVQRLALNLIGIYSGRVRMPGNKDANLGVVYDIANIEEIFSDPVVATHPFPPFN